MRGGAALHGRVEAVIPGEPDAGRGAAHVSNVWAAHHGGVTARAADPERRRESHDGGNDGASPPA
jgi:hypothetical protein